MEITPNHKCKNIQKLAVDCEENTLYHSVEGHGEMIMKAFVNFFGKWVTRVNFDICNKKNLRIQLLTTHKAQIYEGGNTLFDISKCNK